MKLKPKYTSQLFQTIKRGTPGRRLTRKLNDTRVNRALIRSEDLIHQMKFMSPGKRLATALSLQS